MSQQWLRKVSLIVAGKDGKGLDLAQFKIRFEVRHKFIYMPGVLEATIFNLKKETINLIKSYGNPSPNDYDPTGPQIILQAGYAGNYGVIFKGNIKQIMVGRDGPENSYVHLFAADGDLAYTYDTINKTLASGWNQKDLYGVCQNSFTKHGITAGETPATLKTIPAPRGRVCFGMTRDIMHNVAANNGLEWLFIQNELVSIPISAYRQGEAIELNMQSGLINVPMQSETAITFMCLLNPSIKWGSRIKINNKLIAQYLYDKHPAGITPAGQAPVMAPAPLSNAADVDGYYKVFYVDHHGDTRGEEWYTEITALAVDSTTPFGASGVMGVPPPP